MADRRHVEPHVLAGVRRGGEAAAQHVDVGARPGTAQRDGVFALALPRLDVPLGGGARGMPPGVPHVGQHARQEQHGERNGVVEVAPPKRWPLLDAPQPFEPGALHPGRGASHGASGEVDHRAEVGDDRHVEARAVDV